MVSLTRRGIVWALLLVSGPALADVPPWECTLEQYDRPDQICETCEASTTNSGACRERYAGTSFEFECESDDRPVWTEVWCRDSEVPERCSLEDSSVVGRNCEECDASYQVPDLCLERFSGQDYTQHCTSGGSIFWTEVWCTESALGANDGVGDDAAMSAGGCQGVSEGVPLHAWLAIIPIMGLTAARLRRHFRMRV